MINPKETFTMKEISLATGIDAGKMNSRYKVRIRSEELPAGLKSFTYEQVKILLTTRKRGAPDLRKVDQLKRQLIDDGFAKK